MNGFAAAILPVASGAQCCASWMPNPMSSIVPWMENGIAGVCVCVYDCLMWGGFFFWFVFSHVDVFPWNQYEQLG
jgi:hypothetical protein